MSHPLLGLFSFNFSALPDSSFIEEAAAENPSGDVVRTFRKKLPTPEFDVFDELEVKRIGPDGLNIFLSSLKGKRPPASAVRFLVDNLYRVLGTDHQGKSEFTESDLNDYESEYGRLWRDWSLEPKHGIPIDLYQSEEVVTLSIFLSAGDVSSGLSAMGGQRTELPVTAKRQPVSERLAALTFTAIDFETANEQRDSLCAIGVAQVENGVVVKTWKMLVHPPELRVSEINQSVHRIRHEDLLNAPTFPEIWDEFKELIEDAVVVAHNAEFDMNVLKQTLDHYGLEEPSIQSLCTLKLSQVAFPQLDDYRLADVTKYLGLEFRHHSCDEDARVCAEIAIQAIPRVSLKKFDLDDVDLTHSWFKAPSKTKVSGFSEAFADKRIDSDLLKPQLEGADPNHPFYGKRLVFTGDLRAMQRSEAAEMVRALGADINTSISKKTQIVVIGDGAGPSKLRKIEELQDQGVEIRIIYEDELLQILG